MVQSVLLKDETSKQDYLVISTNKLKDAYVLYTHNRFEGACYIVGYTLECVVKYIILREFQCNKRKDVWNLYKNPESCVRRVYDGLFTGINDFKISIFGKEYTKSNIDEFKSMAKTVYCDMLDKHSFEKALEHISTEKKVKLDLNRYKYALDWSEQWRYRMYSDGKHTQHDINNEENCKKLIEEIIDIINQFYHNEIITPKEYETYFKKVIESELKSCLNTSVQ